MKRICLALHSLGASELTQSAVRRSLSALPRDAWAPRSEDTSAVVPAPSPPPEVALWLVEGGAWPQACAALCEARAAHPLTVHLVVLAGVPPDGVEQLMAHGAFDFLHHPFSDEEMALRLKRALGAVPVPAPLGTSPVAVRQPQTQDESFQAAKARVVEHFERSYIERLLQASEGNISHAARIAKKNRRAFFELIRKHDIDADRFRMSMG